MRFFSLLMFIGIVFTPLRAAALLTAVDVRTGTHPGFFRVVIEGPGDVIRSIDLGDREGQKREVRIALSEDAAVNLPPSDAWKAGPVRSIRVEDNVLVLTVDPTVPIETHRFDEPDRYVFDFLIPGAPAGQPELPETRAVERAQPEGEGLKDAAAEGGGGTEATTAAQEREPLGARRPRIKFTPDGQAAKISGVRKVAIDPGHGGYDVGLPGEKEIALRIARRIEQALAGVGIRTRITRTANSYVSIGERIELISTFKPDVYLSIHLGRGPFRVYAGGAGRARRDALGLKTRLHTAISLAYGDDAIGEGTAPVALTENLIYLGALVEIPAELVGEGDAAVDTMAGILLSAIGGSEAGRPASSETRGWW